MFERMFGPVSFQGFRYRDVLMSSGIEISFSNMQEGDRGGDPQTGTAAKPRKVPIAFPEDMYEWLREEAFKRHGAMADIVREAVNEYRERSVQQMRLPMKSDR